VALCPQVTDCAIVRIDGRAVSPARSVMLPPGRATIIVGADGHEPTTVVVEVLAGESRQVTVHLRPRPALLTFVSIPPGATVVVDRTRVVARTPARDVPIEPGLRTIQFRPSNPAYRPKTIRGDWRPGVAYTIELTLERSTGRVRIESARRWTRLELDRRSVDFASGAWYEMPAGRHEIEAFAGPDVSRADFDVPPGRAVSVTLVWGGTAPDPASFALVPAATVVLGSRYYASLNPPRTQAVAAFWIMRREVTVAEYRACVVAGGCTAPGQKGEHCNFGSGDSDAHPVNCVSAAQAEAYARWLSSRDGLQYRLPTTNEWERAARGSDGKKYPWGSAPPGGRCNICDRSCVWRWKLDSSDDGWPTTAPAGSHARCHGDGGVYDLIGNVAEWCRSSRQSGHYELRGGSWASPAAYLDPAFPNEKPPDLQDAGAGFRLVVSAVQ
jgi:hypothetical protein